MSGVITWCILNGVSLGQPRAGSWQTQTPVKDEGDRGSLLNVQVWQKLGVTAQQKPASLTGDISLFLMRFSQQAQVLIRENIKGLACHLEIVIACLKYKANRHRGDWAGSLTRVDNVGWGISALSTLINSQLILKLSPRTK